MSTETDNNAESRDRAVTVEHPPATLSSVIAVGAGLLAALTSGAASILTLGIGLLGLVGIAAGLFGIESQRVALVGTAIVFVGVLVSGLLENSSTLLVLSAVLTFVAFDAIQNAFSVGSQMSAETVTTRGELGHTMATLAVGLFAVVLAYGIYAVSGSGQPAAALAFVLITGVVFVWAIRS